MDFLKICWNSKLTREEFKEKYQSFEEEKQIAILKGLAQLSNSPENSNMYFMQYFYAVLEQNPFKSFINIDTNNKTEIDSCNRLLQQYGDRLFNFLPIGTYESAHSSMLALKIILLCQNSELRKSALIQVNHSQIFRVLIASSRVYDAKEFNYVHELYYNHPESKEIRNIVEMPELTLKKLELKDKFIDLQEIVNVAILSYNPWLLKNDLFDYFQPQLNYEYYISLIKRYISAPNLFIAFILTNFFLYIEENGIFNYSGQKFKPEILKKHLNNLYTYSTSPIPIPFDELFPYLSTYPENLPVEKLYEESRQHPVLSSFIYDRFMETFKSGDNQTSIILMKQIIENPLEFMYYFYVMGKNEEIINYLLDVAENTTDESLFHHSWTSVVSMMRLSVCDGSPIALKNNDRFFKERKSPAMIILRCMLDENWSESEITPVTTIEECLNQVLPIMTSVKFLCYLFTETNKNLLIRALAHIEECQILYLPVIIWGTKTKTPLARQIPTKNIPDTLIHKYMLNQMLLFSALPARITGWNLDVPDYLTAIMMPETHNTMNLFLIVRGLELINSINITDTTDITDMFKIWRALIHIHGGKKFASSVISGLMWCSKVSQENAFDPSLFIVCAYHFMILSDLTNDFMPQSCEAILEFLESGNDMNNADAFATFCILCILACDYDNMVKYFTKIFQKSIQILENGKYLFTEMTDYAVRFICDAMYSKSLITLVPDNAYEYLQRMNNWNGIIYFYIAKAESLTQSNNL
ncbi:hypothetical protein TVAG_017370 [Trichomonas vaginalis G3]|uniref:Uncharacterized protein n=1 Tax=Trichomonas vaginalis (strain ATCC PRA-98 / G3) TaxID=412133 RepID=A2FAT6_TRIV3|nr:hypothetical protein TVAGG3_0888990 [Trichomonas vaginalis G3]EAX97965.1 hypothetical protein TVAG_017370 [Trichomonas vaginalis G3]KAI5502586.1 hypothetical protein TVAGG3_0888990 [Trichomonas vaginalis G3]|eukprot:XP_001310895.1 hypothetical protein [Trichomonas vaginalis G3]